MGDTMISISGEPYDSLQEMIGISGDSNQSLKPRCKLRTNGFN